MISKKRLKERVLDICCAVGMPWDHVCEHFDYTETELADTGSLIYALERVFNLGTTSRLRNPWLLKEFDDIDSLVQQVSLALKEKDND